MRIEKNRKSFGMRLFINLAMLICLFAMATSYSFAATQETATKQATQESEGVWSKLTGHMPALVNPLSEISVRDTGTKPRLRPHLYTDTSYNSNPTAQKTSVGAWQARISPGLSLEVPLSSKLYTMMDYTYSFATTQGPDYSDNNNTHNLTNLARYDFTKCTSLGVLNNFQISDLADNAGKRFLLETVKPELTHRWGEKLSSVLGYQFQHYRDVGPLPAEAGVGDNASNYQSRDTFNDNAINTSLTYVVSPKLAVTPNFVWSMRHFDKTKIKDYWSISPSLGATYGIGSKTMIAGNFGWGYRRFRQNGDASDLIYGIGLNHKLGRKMVWGIRYDKTQQDTFDTSIYAREDSIATNLDNYDRHFRVINVHRINSSATYNFNEKNGVNVFGQFEFTQTRQSDNIASSDTNDEKKMETGFMYLYRLTRFLDLRLGYTLGRCFSASGNPNRNQYTYNKVTAGVNVNF